MNHTTHFDDCGCLTARYEARIAALEAELAEAREHAEAWESEADSANTLGQSWMAHANDLRGALEHYAKVDACEVEEPCLHPKCEFPACVASYRRAKVAVAALAQTPAASLAAHDAEVLERAASICDKARAIAAGRTDDRSTVKASMYELVEYVVTECADHIRALAAQEVTK